MGVACIEVGDVEQAAGLFQEAKSVLEETCGPHHLDTLDVSTNLAGSYDALGRYTQNTCTQCLSHGIMALI
jgi:hypothetical protein